MVTMELHGNDPNNARLGVEHGGPPKRDRTMWALQFLAGLAVMGIGVYFASTNRWALGGIVGGVGVSILPFAAASVVGAVVCLLAAGGGWYFGRLSVLVAALAGVLSLVTIVEAIRKR